MITRSNLAEQLRDYQIRSKHDWASVSFFSSTSPNITTSRYHQYLFTLFLFVYLFFFQIKIKPPFFFSIYLFVSRIHGGNTIPFFINLFKSPNFGFDFSYDGNCHYYDMIIM
jgi:hypothetical protein